MDRSWEFQEQKCAWEERQPRNWEQGSRWGQHFFVGKIESLGIARLCVLKNAAMFSWCTWSGALLTLRDDGVYDMTAYPVINSFLLFYSL